VDVTTYDWLLFGHLLFVVTWVGGDVMLQFIGLRALGASPERTVEFAKDVEWIGVRVLTPAALLVVLFGFGLMAELDYAFGEFWIIFALAVYLASFITGAGFLGPESGRIGRLAEERGATDPDVQRRVRRVIVISRIELLFLILVVFDMVVKPGL
jgi:uncharacterized membrane protein